ncbi:Gfo/Idh/MocA family oxidoreductase [Nocardioides sp. ChNu-99]|uniref:Gfo/Idh/MocA family protein n=1 Tax=Nocardioides sp. ChNu-99 TaxID=2839897 RepID=UPI0024049BD8|nr:Gfo/Idh/MocA family oxidoreductase [Nocardioides sp. ChNu-99]MDF9714677.1 Gfo/Idh/MocA family oxidoreductase [Nocardioides sp. ChNu-99]
MVNWGILATGKIARSFARDLALVPDARVVAVGSRSAGSATAFATEFDVPRAHASYEALVADEEVEVVYVASPHALHLAHVRLALEAGKHVLCEKPVALDRADAEEMIALATERGLFFMEAMWMATHPVVREVARRLRAGELGTPRHLHAELGFVVDADPDDRMLDPALGASALLDMGIYPLTLAHLALGEAEELTGVAALSDRGIDLDCAVTGRYPGGALATMTASMTSWSGRSGRIATDRGLVELEPPFHHPARAVFHPIDGDPVTIEGEEPVIGAGYGNEIVEVGRCLAAGLLESPLVPHAQTLTLMAQMDDLRRQLGVTFPG